MGALAATVGAPRRVLRAPRRGLTAPPLTRYTPMATVSPEVRGAQPAPPVRHGTCRLIVIIDGTEYRLSKSPSARAAWHLKHLSEPRKGTVYCVLTHKNIVT